MKKLLLAVFLLVPFTVHAEPVAQCNGTTYLGCRNIGNSTIWLNDPNDINTPKEGYLYIAGGCNSLPQVSRQYMKCVDTDTDGIVDTIEEMTQAEKDVVDAPILAAEQEQQAYETEIISNNWCTATLDDIQTRVDQVKDAWIANRQAALDAASNNAQVKAAIRDDLIPEIGNLIAQGFIKNAKCLRARAARGGLL